MKFLFYSFFLFVFSVNAQENIVKTDSTQNKILISGFLTCDDSEIPVTQGKVWYKNIKGGFGEAEVDSTGYYELLVERELSMLYANSEELLTTELNTQVKKYFSIEPIIVDFTNRSQDTIINIGLPLIVFCALDPRISFDLNTVKCRDFKERITNFSKIIQQNPSILKVEIRGYTSSEEDPKLQRKRANKVFKAILKKGFSKAFVSVNYDHNNEPIKHHNYGCDEKVLKEPSNSLLNARVEFVILEIKE